MNFHHLIHQRDALLRQARLANLAFAYQRLSVYGARIARAGLHGLVRLQPGDPAGDQPWPGLVALEGNQSVLEEHFLDEDGVELADILGFLEPEVAVNGTAFRIEELTSRFLPGLRRELVSGGFDPGAETSPTADSNHLRP